MLPGIALESMPVQILQHIRSPAVAGSVMHERVEEVERYGVDTLKPQHRYALDTRSPLPPGGSRIRSERRQGRDGSVCSLERVFRGTTHVVAPCDRVDPC